MVLDECGLLGRDGFGTRSLVLGFPHDTLIAHEIRSQKNKPRKRDLTEKGALSVRVSVCEASLGELLKEETMEH